MLSSGMVLANENSEMMHILKPLLITAGIFLLLRSELEAQERYREDISLDDGWYTIADEHQDTYDGFQDKNYNLSGWINVAVPHNWDQYEGYRRLSHGNRHGYAWYRRAFIVEKPDTDRQFFLWFEGVGSYATVWLNGEEVGYHAGGRTSFTIDITENLLFDEENILAVRADHPASIRDLPWVCGGCSEEVGFSEGSQPMGIFRPVHLMVTNKVRIEPFGVHVWNDTSITEKEAAVFVNTEVKNYDTRSRDISLVNALLDREGKVVSRTESKSKLKSGTVKLLKAALPPVQNPRLWSPSDPYLYRLITQIIVNGEIIDQEETAYGIRWIRWDIGADGSGQVFVNDEPVFINGTCEYEHMMGMSHAFTGEQVRARVMQMKSAGFNAFRDAHQPHNLRYHHSWDSLGMLWWTQMAAHIWFDTPEFKENFKTLLRDWVKERRNSPSVVLWGLENESTLPTEFARECTEIIREMDPTASSQRLVTTCNGGSGTDWNVPQNWTGTYGGNPDIYDEDMRRQQLIGEYGAWRTLDLHTEGPFDQNGSYSEDRMTLLMEKKIRLAESAKDSTSGHFQWLFTSHENPGRNQSGEAYREMDRVGPVNYKGLLTPWGEPADVFYMYRSNYAPKETEPMVYLVSHTWPGRWSGPGVKDSISVYSNCDEVELFNGVRKNSLGRKKNRGIGTHFQWDNADIQYNLLYAVGYVNGREVATDYLVMHHLPEAPDLHVLYGEGEVIAADQDLHYVYRVNCGGADFIDHEGNEWQADVRLSDTDRWGSRSWTDDFDDMPAFFASQRRTFDPIMHTRNQKLLQTFRYGKHRLSYYFPLPDGDYTVELYFNEPWYGTGGGMECIDWRNFDVALNGHVVLDDLDIWSEAGHDRALVKQVKTSVSEGYLEISFPEVKSGQAVISAIAIATSRKDVQPAAASQRLISMSDEESRAATWLDLGSRQFPDDDFTFQELPPELFGAEYIQTSGRQKSLRFTVTEAADVHVALDVRVEKPNWLSGFGASNTQLKSSNGRQTRSFKLYRKRFEQEAEVILETGRGSDYTVFVTPATKLEPAYDLKPKTQFKSIQAAIKGDDVRREMKYNLDCASYLKPSGDTLQWAIKPGVADYHAFHVKFSNETGQERKVSFRLLANDGSVMMTDVLALRETPVGKYREVTVKTPSMINAGDYTVEIVSVDAEGVCIRGFTMQ